MECTFTGSVSGAGDGVTANVGGIVGANGYNSTVKANTIGSADTVVHGGMVDGTAYETARANAGGIVGTNYGTAVSYTHLTGDQEYFFRYEGDYSDRCDLRGGSRAVPASG